MAHTDDVIRAEHSSAGTTPTCQEREKERWNVRGENILLILSVKCINTQRNRERKKMYVKKRWITILG